MGILDQPAGGRRKVAPGANQGVFGNALKETTMSEIGPGSVIGKGYKLGDKIGESSLGDLYLATNEADGSQVRVEVLAGQEADDEEKVQRLLQEIELIASLQHPNITAALDAGQDDGAYYLVTAYEPGKTLEETLSGGAVAESAALGYVASIAEALKYAWQERKILHRDIKPSSIFITEDDSAKLIGFGIAKSSEGQSMGLTGVGFTIGTPEYMSPEQIRAEGDLDFRSDMYALGCVLYEAATGTLVFTADAPILLMHMHMDEEHEPASTRNGDVSANCSAVIDKMLAKDREDRYESWQDLIEDLNLVAGGGAPVKAGGAAAAPASHPAIEESAAAAAAPAADSSGGAAEPAAAGGGGGCAGKAAMFVAAAATMLFMAAKAVFAG
jgi:serine/threonine protein kinase